MNNFIGNKKTIALLNKILNKGFISHAYLISGPQHVGKTTMAKMFALSLIGKIPQLEMREPDPTASLDLLLLGPEIEEKKGIVKLRSIPVEKIREKQSELSLYPYHGAYKVLIIEDAHMMGVAAQNALLKTLEEPNPTSVLILVTHEESRLLTTIKSRCQQINMTLVSEAEMREIENSSEMIDLAMGRPGLLNMIKQSSDEYEFRSSAIKELVGLINSRVNDKLILAEELSKNVVKTSQKLLLWIWMLRKNLKQRSFEIDESRTYEIIAKIERSVELLKTTNANARLILENLFLEL
jgi:DNA polymerase-3 subunit delta'